MRVVPVLVAHVGSDRHSTEVPRRWDHWDVLAGPALNLGMSIGESESARLVVIKRRNISPACVREWPGAVAAEFTNEKCVVDRVRMFVNKNPHLRRVFD